MDVNSNKDKIKPLFKEGKTHNSIYILINLWPSVLKLYNIKNTYIHVTITIYNTE